MNINRNNAEAFFLDYFEGNLSEEQVAALFAFLKANPDFREVFESFGDISVNDETVAAPDFSFLKKEKVADDHAKAEQWMVDFTEGTISEEDRIALERYLTAFPEKKRELELFAKTMLHADGAEQFGDLSLLKKPVDVSAANFDDFAVQLIEGTISTAELNALEQFVATHPEFAGELEAYRVTRFAPDESVSFEHKNSLRKTTIVVSEENITELLIAKAEGLLTPVENQEVDAFIARFPEYRLELDAIRKTKLIPDTTEVFGDTSSLKRKVIAINDSNFETYMISAIEGLLNNEELDAVHAFAATQPKYKKAMAAYAATRVQADTSIVYANKESLKRKERGGFIWWSAGMRYSAAAALLLLFGLYFWMKSGSGTGDVMDHGIADNKKQSVTPEVKAPVVPENENNGQVQLADQNGSSNTNGTAVQPVIPSEQHQHVNPETAFAARVVDNQYVAERKNVNELSSSAADQQVQYSEAFYAVVFNGENSPAPANEKEFVSPGQLAMRWMKDKIDGNNEDVLLAGNDDPTKDRNRDRNVDGLDLTESAVNRVGEATGGRISMGHREDGTYLQLWNYSVRVSSAQ